MTTTTTTAAATTATTTATATTATAATTAAAATTTTTATTITNYNYATPHHTILYIQQSCEWGDHCNHSKKHNSNHLSVHQWIRSAINASQQLTSPIGFHFWNFRHRLVRYYWYAETKAGKPWKAQSYGTWQGPTPFSGNSSRMRINRLHASLQSSPCLNPMCMTLSALCSEVASNLLSFLRSLSLGCPQTQRLDAIGFLSLSWHTVHW